MQQLQVIRLGTDEAVGFAAEELARYLGEATGEQPGVKAADAAPAVEPGGLWVGTFADFGDGLRHWPETGDAALDDAVFIETAERRHHSRVEPAQHAVRRIPLFEGAGLPLGEPGREGDRVPAVSVEATAGARGRTASVRHRGSASRARSATRTSGRRGLVGKNASTPTSRSSRSAHVLHLWYTHMRTRFWSRSRSPWSGRVSSRPG